MTYLQHLVEKFPIRRSAEQKEAFRKYVLKEAASLGYRARVEQSGGKHDNIVIGNPEKAQVTFTAHYDTPAVNFLPNIMMPRNLPLFLGYQMLIVGIMLAAALIVGMIAHMALHEVRLAYIIGWLFYMGLLMLMIYGPSNKHNVNDNTSGVSALLETMAKIPADKREQVLSILKETPGSICVVLYMEDEKKAYQAPREYWVDEGYDFGALANLLGADSIVLK